MQIYELTADRIKDTARVSGMSFEYIKDLYFESIDRGCTIFVRTERDWLQWVFVSHAVKDDPDIRRMIMRHSMWREGRNGLNPETRVA